MKKEKIYFRKYKLLTANSGEELERKLNTLMEEVGGPAYVNWRGVEYQHHGDSFSALVLIDGYKDVVGG